MLSKHEVSIDELMNTYPTVAGGDFSTRECWPKNRPSLLYSSLLFEKFIDKRTIEFLKIF